MVKRMHRLKKVISILLGMSLIFSLALYQKQTVEQETREKRDSNKWQETQGKEEALVRPKNKITLNLWLIETETTLLHKAYTNAIKEFEKDYPDIKINFEYFESESYKTKLKNAVATNELPDIFFSWQGGFSQYFAESGKLLNLEPYYEKEYKDLLPEEKTKNSRYNGKGFYGVGYSEICSVLMYNKDILNHYNLEAPDNWEEFMNVCRVLSSQGMTPLAVSMKDTWCLACIHDQLIVKGAGHDMVEKMLNGDEKYEGKACTFAAQQMKELADMPAFFSDATEISYNEQLERFKEGKAAMMVQLGNNCNDVYSTSDHSEIFDVKEFPIVNNEISVTEQVGGSSEALWVNAATKYPDVAAYTAFELARNIGAELQREGIAISPWTDSPEMEEINPVHRKLKQINEEASSYTLWFDTAMTGDNAGEYLTLLQQLCTDKISVDEFMAGMKEQLQK